MLRHIIDEVRDHVNGLPAGAAECQRLRTELATTATERSHPDGDSPIAANVAGVPEVSSSADALSLYQADPGKGTRCYGAIGGWLGRGLAR